MQTLKYDPTTSPTVVLALSDLSIASLTLLKQHLGDGPWLESCRQQMITGIKNYGFEGCAMEKESAQVQSAIAVVNLIFDQVATK